MNAIFERKREGERQRERKGEGESPYNVGDEEVVGEDEGIAVLEFPLRSLQLGLLERPLLNKETTPHGKVWISRLDQLIWKFDIKKFELSPSLSSSLSPLPLSSLSFLSPSSLSLTSSSCSSASYCSCTRLDSFTCSPTSARAARAFSKAAQLSAAGPLGALTEFLISSRMRSCEKREGGREKGGESVTGRKEGEKKNGGEGRSQNQRNFYFCFCVPRNMHACIHTLQTHTHTHTYIHIHPPTHPPRIEARAGQA